ncbi:MAG: tRNA (adenosine(37)-N6)-threonylcarbamoyltransferase complex ATPase subunit type 1 TsaE [Candidatus Omnitrophica bacterium]|nr:tRNA (adenosine(37)-N6)-threonylcarbamoyltransferase complex ATPase subunit type 1 TsaE [Candidatus Omnitrophota bacterium]
MNANKTIITASPEETIQLGARFAAKLNAGDVVALIGDLGSGKTVFVKGMALGLGVKDPLYVNSPSFVILKEYTGKKKLYHFDVYRLDQKGFCETLDHEKYFYGDGITVIEWADKIDLILPEGHVKIKISYEAGDKRSFQFSPPEKYKKIIGDLRKA